MKRTFLPFFRVPLLPAPIPQPQSHSISPLVPHLRRVRRLVVPDMDALGSAFFWRAGVVAVVILECVGLLDDTSMPLGEWE